MQTNKCMYDAKHDWPMIDETMVLYDKISKFVWEIHANQH